MHWLVDRFIAPQFQHGDYSEFPVGLVWLFTATVSSLRAVHPHTETAQFYSILASHLKFNKCIFPVALPAVQKTLSRIGWSKKKKDSNSSSWNAKPPFAGSWVTTYGGYLSNIFFNYHLRAEVCGKKKKKSNQLPAVFYFNWKPASHPWVAAFTLCPLCSSILLARSAATLWPIISEALCLACWCIWANIYTVTYCPKKLNLPQLQCTQLLNVQKRPTERKTCNTQKTEFLANPEEEYILPKQKRI